MELRTDLAMERREALDRPDDGIFSEEYDKGGAKIYRIKVTSDPSAQAIGIVVGYILFLLIFSIPSLPAYQKYGISMTIGQR